MTTQAHPNIAQPLRLGVLADSQKQLGKLVELLKETTHTIEYTALTSSDLPLEKDVDAWVVRIEEHEDRADQFIQWLSEQDIPTVVDDVSDGHDRRTISIAQWFDQKILECVQTHYQDSGAHSLPNFIWVLAASTGGPEAVVEFLSTLGEQTLDSAFIYAQHIDSPAIASLKVAVARRSAFNIVHCDHSTAIESGNLYIVSPDHEFELQAGSRLVLTGQRWKGPYRPSINQVIAKVARNYREKSGVIMFTGMGDDGAEAVRMMRVSGGKVFSQTADSCTIDSMPLSAERTGCVEFTGSVAALSQRVNDLSTLASSLKIAN